MSVEERVESVAHRAAVADGSQLAHLFQEHNASLVQLLRVRLRSAQEADDVAQEAYACLLQLDRLGTIGYLRAYLFRTALNIASNRLRHAAVHEKAMHDAMLEPGVDELSPDRVVLAREALSAVARTLEQLPVKARYAFLLYRLAGLGVGEVAARIGVSNRTVHSYIVQALRCCHDALSSTREPARGPESPS